MTFKDTTKMTERELDRYERELLDLYEETFGQSYGMPFFRPNTDVVVADLIHCLKTGQKKVWPEDKYPLPEGAVI